MKPEPYQPSLMEYIQVFQNLRKAGRADWGKTAKQEKASRLDRLTRTIGANEIDRLLSQRSAHEHSRYKARETNR